MAADSDCNDNHSYSTVRRSPGRQKLNGNDRLRDVIVYRL